MWSILTIDYANREYVREQAEREAIPEPIETLTKRAEAVPPSEPLATLVARLRRSSPPALDLLLEMLRPVAGYKEFASLVKEFLPDMEEEIMAESGHTDRMHEFCTSFSDRYFPLIDDYFLQDDVNNYYVLTNNIPVYFQPFSQDWYDDIPLSDNKSEIVLAYILQNPWMDTDRAAFAEAATKHIPEKLLRHIPEEGFPINELEIALKDTPFEPVVFWGMVIAQSTGNRFFDCSSLDETGEEFEVVWNRPTVDELTRQYQAWEAWMEKWREFTNWFDKNLTKNATELVRILSERIENDERKSNGEDGDDLFPVNDPRQGRLFDIFANETPVAGATSSQNTAGQTDSPFGLL
ncbi:MAG: hypothetical protein PHN44_00485 [Candidatus Marinimicrobia bacterium]|nr:hypothetical protein [Candidatus Neomarinimicrobiota bacterium]MDD5539067.1 hypothetical protein [Candidatus Neomarinimicrobiota bacterium]